MQNQTEALDTAAAETEKAREEIAQASKTVLSAVKELEGAVSDTQGLIQGIGDGSPYPRGTGVRTTRIGL